MLSADGLTARRRTPHDADVGLATTDGIVGPCRRGPGLARLRHAGARHRSRWARRAGVRYRGQRPRDDGPLLLTCALLGFLAPSPLVIFEFSPGVVFVLDSRGAAPPPASCPGAFGGRRPGGPPPSLTGKISGEPPTTTPSRPICWVSSSAQHSSTVSSSSLPSSCVTLRPVRLAVPVPSAFPGARAPHRCRSREGARRPAGAASCRSRGATPGMPTTRRSTRRVVGLAVALRSEHGHDEGMLNVCVCGFRWSSVRESRRTGQRSSRYTFRPSVIELS